MQNPLAIAITVALLASVLFLAVLASGLGLVFIFLPSLPLFVVGLAKSPKMALQAGALASLPIILVTGSPLLAIIFFYAFAIPCWFMSRLLRQHYDLHMGEKMPILRLWYPAGLTTLYLAIYGCSILAIVTAFFATQETNLPQHLASSVQAQIAAMQKEYNVELNVAPADISFMVFGFFVWLWAIALWAHAWLANFVLVKKKMAVRPSLAITPFPMPNWLLSLMGICALASLIGGESMRFLGKASLIILLMPYFFQGAALLHLATQKWSNQRFFLFFVYFAIALLFWPAFVLSGIGLWQHVKMLNKSLSNGGNSHIS